MNAPSTGQSRSTDAILRIVFRALALLSLAAAPAAAQSAAPLAPTPPGQIEAEKAAIRQVITEGYIEGIFIKADPEAIRKAWHPACDIVVFQNGSIVKNPAYNWVRRFERQPKPLDPNARGEFVSISVSGNAAVAVLELKSGDRPVYTDIMSLYKFDDGWKIVTKIYYSYPTPAPAR